MLQDIRDNSQGVIAKVIIGLIVAVFALFGVDSIIGGFIASPPVAEVNGEEISEAQLQNNTQQFLNSTGGDIGSIDQDLLEQIALNQLIEEVVLRQSAENGSMLVSSNRIDRNILDTQSFQIGGVFDSDLAIRTMASQGFSVPLYRETLRQQMIMAQLANAYSSSNFITATEMQRVAELTAQTRDFRYLSVTLGTRTLGTAISDAEIQTHYDTNSADFAEEETVVVRYVTLDKDVIAAEIQVDETELRALYESEQESFAGASEKRASHIMFEVGSDLSEDEALQLASATQQRLLDGENFGALALELSTDVVSAEEGGDIGYSDGGAFPTEIEEVLEVLNLNEVSGPVITEFGVHLVKLTEDAENVFQSYEEVVDRLERDLKSAEVELTYAGKLEDLSNLAFETGELITISQELNLTVEESDPTGRAGGRGIFANQLVVAAAFSDDVLLEGNNSDVLELSESQSVVLRVQEFNEASIRPLEDVEPEIAVLLRTEMERDAVQSLGEQLMVAAESGAGLDTLVQLNELEWISQDAVERNAITVNRQILTEVFGMPKPENGPELASLSLDNGTFVLLELNQVNIGSVDSLAEEQRITLTNNLRVDLGNNDFQAYLSNLRSNADIQTARAAEQF